VLSRVREVLRMSDEEESLLRKKKRPKVLKTFRLDAELVQKLERIVEESNRESDEDEQTDMTHVVNTGLKWFVRELERIQGKKRGAK
jgi:hypothetical protein